MNVVESFLSPYSSPDTAQPAPGNHRHERSAGHGNSLRENSRPARHPLAELTVPGPLHTISGRVRVSSETAALKKVIVGFPTRENFDHSRANPINRMSLMTLNGQNPAVPLEQAQNEFRTFYRVLQSYGVEVASPAPVSGLYDQIYTRDIAGVIGGVLVPANMSTAARNKEPKALASLLGSLHREHLGSIKVAPLRDPVSAERIHFEFGDIFPHGDQLFIGKSERTNWAAIRWFEREFSGQFQIVPVELVKPSETQEALHLDCAFNLVGSHEKPIALLHRASLVDPDKLLRSLPNGSRIIEVSDSEQENYATNVLSIDERTVVIRDLCVQTAERLEELGLTTHKLPFDAAAAMGGLFRCCSMPLLRG